jgi:hypothetical protein
MFIIFHVSVASNASILLVAFPFSPCFPHKILILPDTVLTSELSECGWDWDGCIGLKLYMERFQMIRKKHHGLVTVFDELFGTFVVYSLFI